MKKILALKFFYDIAGQVITWLKFIVPSLLMLGIVWGLCFAPIDYQQQDAFKIIYVHVPSALLSLSIYSIMGIASIVYLIWRIKLADIIAKVSAPIGGVFTMLALITGAIWGKPMWGTWWVWDARLTAELILLFLYLGYIGLRDAVAVYNGQLAAKMAAVLAVVGLIDIPIIHFSVQWWQTLHQGATISKLAKPAIALEMLYPLIIMIIAFYLFYVLCVCIAAKAEILQREANVKWLREKIYGKI